MTMHAEKDWKGVFGIHIAQAGAPHNNILYPKVMCSMVASTLYFKKQAYRLKVYIMGVEYSQHITRLYILILTWNISYSAWQKDLTETEVSECYWGTIYILWVGYWLKIFL